MQDMVHGVFTAIVTQFRDDGVDWAAVERLLEDEIEAGIHGIVPCGTTGESATLSVDEHDQIIRFVVETVDGRVPVIAGAGLFWYPGAQPRPPTEAATKSKATTSSRAMVFMKGLAGAISDSGADT